MGSRVPHVRPDRLVVFPGTQSILFNLLAYLAKPGDLVLTEALTFPGLKAAAARLGIKLAGVAMDEEGILPDALAIPIGQMMEAGLDAIKVHLEQLGNPRPATSLRG